VSTDTGLSQNAIEQGLREAGLCEGTLVEVHSSLSSFGYVHGGADTVIQALINTVGPDGGIVMPSFLLSPPQELTPLDIARGLTCKIKVLPPDHEERSGMGIIADTFRKRADVLTGEGMFRVSAWGKDQEINSQGFQHVMDSGGWGLLLGVDIYRLSAMHYVEAELPQEITNLFKPADEVRQYYPADAWYIETGVPPVKAWYKIQDEAYRRGYIQDTRIGNCKCMSFRVRQVVDLYARALHTDPLGLYGLR